MIRAAVLATALLLGGCGLRPLYAGGESGMVRQTLSGVEVAPIAGQNGWLMANALRDRLRAEGPARYRLEIRLDDDITGLGVRRDDSITRERRILRARYQLTDLSDNRMLLDATAGSDAGIDVVQSEYATIAAENSALERLAKIVADEIVTSVAITARNRAKTPSTGQ